MDFNYLYDIKCIVNGYIVIFSKLSSISGMKTCQY